MTRQSTSRKIFHLFVITCLFITGCATTTPAEKNQTITTTIEKTQHSENGVQTTSDEKSGIENDSEEKRGKKTSGLADFGLDLAECLLIVGALVGGFVLLGNPYE